MGTGSSRDRTEKPDDLDEIVREVARFTLDKKGEEVIVLDLRKLTDATDFFIMVSGDSDVQVRAIADHVIDRIRETRQLKPWHVEGYQYGTWILLDYIDFVLHVFEKSTREYYQLERLWGDAETVEFDPEPFSGSQEGETLS